MTRETAQFAVLSSHSKQAQAIMTRVPNWLGSDLPFLTDIAIVLKSVFGKGVCVRVFSKGMRGWATGANDARWRERGERQYSINRAGTTSDERRLFYSVPQSTVIRGVSGDQHCVNSRKVGLASKHVKLPRRLPNPCRARTQ